MFRTLSVVALCLALALPVAACGKKGKLVPPPGSDVPQSYPTR